jgi:hypothetical protein
MCIFRFTDHAPAAGRAAAGYVYDIIKYFLQGRWCCHVLSLASQLKHGTDVLMVPAIRTPLRIRIFM